MKTKECTVVFYLTVKFDDIEFKSKNIAESFFLKDKKHDADELNLEAYHVIKERYKSLFTYDNFIIHIIGINYDS